MPTATIFLEKIFVRNAFGVGHADKLHREVTENGLIENVTLRTLVVRVLWPSSLSIDMQQIFSSFCDKHEATAAVPKLFKNISYAL